MDNSKSVISINEYGKIDINLKELMNIRKITS